MIWAKTLIITLKVHTISSSTKILKIKISSNIETKGKKTTSKQYSVVHWFSFINSSLVKEQSGRHRFGDPSIYHVKSKSLFRQGVNGTTTSLANPFALLQEAWADPLILCKTRFTLPITISVHGFSLLQSNITATSVFDVPCISSYLTFDISTPDSCNKIYQLNDSI